MSASHEFITAVHLVQAPDAEHPHIGSVKLLGGAVQSRADVIWNITFAKVQYWTYSPNVPEARVIVADCPRCGTGDYITTAPDSTPDNNLLELPRF